MSFKDFMSSAKAFLCFGVFSFVKVEPSAIKVSAGELLKLVQPLGNAPSFLVVLFGLVPFSLYLIGKWLFP